MIRFGKLLVTMVSASAELAVSKNVAMSALNIMKL
jgi:hypothetical protein